MSAGMGAARVPLFLRIFAVLLAAILCAQLLDFAALLVVPPPSPPVYPIADVARALIVSTPMTGVRVETRATPPDQAGDAHADRLRAGLARLLDRPVQDVRLVLDRPLLFRAQHFHPHFPGGPPPPASYHEDWVFGDFRAAVRLPDGRWRVVRPVSSRIEPWHWRMLFWLLCLIVAVAPFAWLVSRRVAAPIGLFAAAADAIGRDPRAAPLSLDGPPEVALAAASFNEMQRRITRYVDDRVTMVAAIAHDLRTPLMRLALRAESAPAPLRDAMEGDVADMTAMINAALAFVRDTGQPARRQRLSLRSLVESVTEAAADQGAAVTVEPGEDVVIEADVSGLKTLVANLIDNAVFYAGTASVRVARDDGHALIEVADDGPGIPEGELDRVFEPFYRLERSRNRETGGTGLGLASARAVARAHGGDVTLSNRAEGGLVARVLLPL